MSTHDTGGEPAPSPPAKKLTVQIDGFRAHRSGSLVGFVDITIIELSLRIRDATVHQKNESRWISMPARAQITSDGTVRRNDQGTIAYTPVLEFTRRRTREAFSARAIEALLDRFPAAFDDEAAA